MKFSVPPRQGTVFPATASQLWLGNDDLWNLLHKDRIWYFTFPTLKGKFYFFGRMWREKLELTALFGGCTVQVFTVQPMSTPFLTRTGAAMAVAETRTSVRRESFIVAVLEECVWEKKCDTWKVVCVTTIANSDVLITPIFSCDLCFLIFSIRWIPCFRKVYMIRNKLCLLLAY